MQEQVSALAKRGLLHALVLRPVVLRAVVLGAIAMASLLVGCSDKKLVPIPKEKPKVVDDLVDLEADFCTRPPDDSDFPVKILLVLDTSGSLQFTDQSGMRRTAVRQLLSTLGGQGTVGQPGERARGVQIGMLGFGSNIYAEPRPSAANFEYFRPASEWTSEPEFMGLADVQTNYHGALSAVYSHLLGDMLQTAGGQDGSAELARTKYVVVFFSDGAPSPKCCITVDESVGAFGRDPFGCPLEGWEVATPGTRYCEDSEEQPICNDEQYLDRFRTANPNAGGGAPNYGDGDLPALNELETNDNYNRLYQIEDLTRDIMELGEAFKVGEMRFHTTLLFDATLPDAIKQIYRLNRCRSEQLLRRMADIGNGVFRDFENGQDIDFLSFNFTSLKERYTLLGAYAVNLSALPPPENAAILDHRPDADGDGLDDDEEIALGLDPVVADSDKQVALSPPDVVPVLIANPDAWGDGYNDTLEHRRRDLGFDPRYQSLPRTTCIDPILERYDTDGDGLRDCEEVVIGTDILRPDTDGDTMSDFLEMRFGLDPGVHEGDSDSDFDGTPNIEEIKAGRDPLVPDADRESSRARYEILGLGDTDDGRTCYKAHVRGIHLATTSPRLRGGRRGFNDIAFYIAEAPSTNATDRVELRRACVRVQYIKPNFKDPPQGEVRIDETDFVDLSDNDDVLRLNEEDTCVGLALR